MNKNNSPKDTNKFPDPTAANIRTLFKCAQQMVAAASGTSITPDKFVSTFGGEVAGMLNTVGVLQISKMREDIHNLLAYEIKQILFGMHVEIAKQVDFVNAEARDNFLHLTNVAGVVGIEDGVHASVKEVEISKTADDGTIIVVKAVALFGMNVSRTYKFNAAGIQLPTLDNNGEEVRGWQQS